MSAVNELDDDSPNDSTSPRLRHSLLSTTYIVPAIFLNPVLFLHSVNTVLTQILPPLNDRPWSHTAPHIDVHSSGGACWGFTMIMIIAQLVAFRKVGKARQDVKDLNERASR